MVLAFPIIQTWLGRERASYMRSVVYAKASVFWRFDSSIASFAPRLRTAISERKVASPKLSAGPLLLPF